MSGINRDSGSFDFVGALEPLPQWQHLMLIAAAATRYFPGYEKLADADEQRVYAEVAEALWRARSVETAELRGHLERLMAMWPSDEIDVLTPYYHKISFLFLLKIGIEYGITRGTVDAVRATVLGSKGLVGHLEGTIKHSGMHRPLCDHSDYEYPYAEREFDNFLSDLTELGSNSDPEAAVARVRSASRTEAEFFGGELLPLWIQAEGWTSTDLASAHGAAQQGR